MNGGAGFLKDKHYKEPQRQDIIQIHHRQRSESSGRIKEDDFRTNLCK